MTLYIEKCTLKDIHTLQEISVQTFKETFEHQNTKENMDSYIEQSFNIKQLTEELSNDASQFFLIYGKGEVTGYLKVNFGDAQTEKVEDKALEIERIYIRKQSQRLGHGKLLLQHAIQLATRYHKRKVWLGVWEENKNAIDFYKKMGFIQTGSHSFYMGDEEQTDFIMVKELG